MKDFEQHLQTGVAASVLAVLMWGGITLNTLQLDVAVLKVDLQHVKAAVARSNGPNSHTIARVAPTELE